MSTKHEEKTVVAPSTRDVDLVLGLEARKWHGLGLEPLALASASTSEMWPRPHGLENNTDKPNTYIAKLKFVMHEA
jgi:hypothetical protein